MTTQNETWQKACVIAGVWKPGQRCDRIDNDGYCAIHNGLWSRSHEIPCPPVGDPATFAGMLDWAIANTDGVDFSRPHSGMIYCELEPRTEEGGPTSALALAAAIVAIGEKL